MTVYMATRYNADGEIAYRGRRTNEQMKTFLARIDGVYPFRFEANGVVVIEGPNFTSTYVPLSTPIVTL